LALAESLHGRRVERLLKDRGKGPRAGKKPISAEVRLAIVTRTAKEKPKHATHWSARMLAEEIGVGHTTVQRVWKEHGLKPHLSRPFKLSNDPKFAEKVVDIVGLYLNPPDKAVVLCVDEKSQIQALDRTQPGLPMKKGRAQTMTHDYKRNGTTTLFAALDVKTGKVIGECLPRHRAKEFIRFLKKIDRAVEKHLDVHAICDNYKTHKTNEVQAWLVKHPRFKLHFTPNHPPANPPRRLQERRRTRGCHRDLAHRAQRQTEALQVDRQSQYHPGEECTRQAGAGRTPRGGY
jgi:transposase